MASSRHTAYKVAWICSTSLEMTAAVAMLDKRHDTLPESSTDPSTYVLGELSGHYIVIVCLPTGVYGTTSSAITLSRMLSKFREIWYCLMVGIGGGVPSPRNDIRLGDVVVSKPEGKYSGVVQYDVGKTVQGVHLGISHVLEKPPTTILTGIGQFMSAELLEGRHDLSIIVRNVLERNPKMKNIYSPPDFERDYLFRSSYHHKNNKNSSCEMCSKEQLVLRQPRSTTTPYVHYGLIATAKSIMRDPEIRDQLAREHGILCFELGAAGLIDSLPTLVIRGICNYCDSHDQKEWWGYSALTAAAYAKVLLSYIPVNRLKAVVGPQTSQSSPDDNISRFDDLKHLQLQGDETHVIAPPTDPGYASMPDKIFTYDKMPTENESTNYLLEPKASSTASEDNNIQNAETASTYTEGPRIEPVKQEKYISELAEELFSKIQINEYDDDTPEIICRLLTRLLKIFAIKLGLRGSTQIHRDIMVFIRRHRSAIAEIVKLKFTEHDGVKPELPGFGGNSMDLNDIMTLWEGRMNDEDIFNREIELETSSSDDDEEETSSDIPEIAAYRELITKDPAYRWLLDSVHRELLLTTDEPDSRSAIRTEMLDFLSSPHLVNKRHKPCIYQVTLVLNWDIIGFIQAEDFDQKQPNFLGKIITITGSYRYAQALTCSEYLNQTWHSYGTDLLQLIERTIIAGPGVEIHGMLPDKTEIRLSLINKEFIVKIVGLRDAILDIGEQLSWLGAALRSSPYEAQIFYCTPYLDSVKTLSTPDCDTENSSSDSPTTKISFGINFTCNWQQQGMSTGSTGQCWHNLFQNPTVVTGYPVRRRSQIVGLEIPLRMMAGLIGVRSLDTFNNGLLIKGFSCLLVPTEYKEDQSLVLWHLIYNPYGNHISYSENKIKHPGNLTMSSLVSCRHIVGWCSEAKYCAGVVDNPCLIDRSRLPMVPPRCMLSGKAILASKLIVGGSFHIYGNKDIPHRLIRDHYVEKLQWLSKKYVVLWDVCDKRGWLVNGPSALLHLLCSSLEFNKVDHARSAFRLDTTKIRKPHPPYTISSAMEILLSPENLNLELYRPVGGSNQGEVTPSPLVQDRVEQLYSMLEKIIEYQIQIMRPVEVIGDTETSKAFQRPGSIPRKILEGWDFKELATFEDPLYPRIYKLGTRGKSWVDFTRALPAATLFATNLGEIIQPVFHAQSSCSYWSQLPAGKSLLAVSGPDLAEICDRYGNPNTTPVRLTQDLIWYSTNDTALDCSCMNPSTEKKHVDLAQVILPARVVKNLPKDQCVRKTKWETGAVILGFNKELNWIWKDYGLPERGTAPLSLSDTSSESDGDFHDSGLGTSILPAPSVEETAQVVTISASPANGFGYGDYEVGIICALPKELLAVRALFDAENPDLERVDGDPNAYNFGYMEGFNVVAAGLPATDYGNNSATNVASHLIRTFPRIKFCLLVGIGGGVPSTTDDIRLGDVVVGTSVIQYDLGKHIQNAQFKMTGYVQRPSATLSSVITKIQSESAAQVYSTSNQLLDHVRKIGSGNLKYRFPGVKRDKLFKAHTVHKQNEPNCGKCRFHDRRKPRSSLAPQIFYGTIASGNKLMKDAFLRDRLGSENNVICFEMEAAGVMRSIDCLVIRGISDYADSHKNDEWQEYAAAAAAAYARVFLSRFPRGKNPEGQGPNVGSLENPSDDLPVLTPSSDRLSTGQQSAHNSQPELQGLVGDETISHLPLPLIETSTMPGRANEPLKAEVNTQSNTNARLPRRRKWHKKHKGCAVV